MARRLAIGLALLGLACADVSRAVDSTDPRHEPAQAIARHRLALAHEFAVTSFPATEDRAESALDQPILSFKYSANGEYVLAGGYSVVWVWNARTGEPVLALDVDAAIGQPHPGMIPGAVAQFVADVDVDKDGQRLAAVVNRGEVEAWVVTWELPSGEPSGASRLAEGDDSLNARLLIDRGEVWRRVPDLERHSEDAEAADSLEIVFEVHNLSGELVRTVTYPLENTGLEWEFADRDPRLLALDDLAVQGDGLLRRIRLLEHSSGSVRREYVFQRGASPLDRIHFLPGSDGSPDAGDRLVFVNNSTMELCVVDLRNNSVLSSVPVPNFTATVHLLSDEWALCLGYERAALVAVTGRTEPGEEATLQLDGWSQDDPNLWYDARPNLNDGSRFLLAKTFSHEYGTGGDFGLREYAVTPEPNSE